MAGIYFHIPFCKQACSYCDFHFSTNLSYQERMVSALIKEIEQRRRELPNTKIETIYFGGGTPSMLTGTQIQQLINTCYAHFEIVDSPEITLEANPDDLNEQQLSEWNSARISRISLGVQSFDENDLLWMKRAHNQDQAIKALELISASPMKLSADLIYGLPSGIEVLEQNIQTLINFQPEHISAYCLTVESKTLLNHWVDKEVISLPNDEQQAEQFNFLLDKLTHHGYEQYEISNFCRDENYALHNSNYWRNKPYLGIGPSAHSMIGNTRKWNVANNHTYMQGIENNIPNYESEHLTPIEKFNEMILTGLRTKWGVDLTALYKINQPGEDFFQNLEELKAKNWVTEVNSLLTLTKSGKLFADHISSLLFMA